MNPPRNDGFASAPGLFASAVAQPPTTLPLLAPSAPHIYWARGFISIKMAREGWDWQRYAAQLDGRISAEMIARWGRGSVYDWIEESRLFAAANGYLRADAMTSVCSGDALGEDWYLRNLPVAEQRLQQGGVRLALVLEELF